MGTEWMESKCQSAEERTRLAPLRSHLTFERSMERSLLQENWNRCAEKLTQGGSGLKVPRAPSSYTRLAMPAADVPMIRRFIERKRSHAGDVGNNGGGNSGGGNAIGSSGAPLYDCLREVDAGLADKFESELLGDWPSSAESGPFEDAVRLLGHCSEMMLFPPGALIKGSQYGEQLEEWARHFPREQLRVIHTDELSGQGRAQAVMDATFRFLGLPPIILPANETRMCVHGKAGVMDVLNAFEGSVRIGSAHAAPEQLNVGACDTTAQVVGMHRDGATGALHHDIDPDLLRRMRTFYEPFNQRLYRFLGRDLGW